MASRLFPRTAAWWPSIHDHGVVLIELATGQVRHEFQHHGKVEPALAWQADGRVLAAASPEAPVYLWDIVGNRTGNPVEWNPANDDVRWANLCDSDASAAFRSLRQLWAHPDRAVAFLKARISRSVDARVASRVCEALELIRTPDARALLVKWAASSATIRFRARQAVRSSDCLPCSVQSRG